MEESYGDIRLAGSKSLKMYMRSGKRSIPSTNPIPVSIDEALAELNSFPLIDVFREGFIGFVNGRGDSIQFIKLSPEVWLADAPQIKGEEYVFSHQIEVSHGDLKKILEKFYYEEDWRIEFYSPRAIKRGKRDLFKALWILGVSVLILIIAFFLLLILMYKSFFT
ncbi:MAG: hypothetical protein ACUVV4_04365 [Candidatus Bathyarchaeia archaeon]